MSDELTLPCNDRTDPECWGRVSVEEVSESYHQLSPEQKRRFHEEAREHESRDDFIAIIDSIEVSAEPATCGACGSDQ